jgi:hypothetical protein
MDENLEKFKALFPMEVKVTKNIINTAKIFDTRACIGALALRKGLGKKGLDLLKERRTSWGLYDGHQIVLIEDDISAELVCSYDENDERVDMTDVEEPFTVTFKLD